MYHHIITSNIHDINSTISTVCTNQVLFVASVAVYMPTCMKYYANVCIYIIIENGMCDMLKSFQDMWFLKSIMRRACRSLETNQINCLNRGL